MIQAFKNSMLRIYDRFIKLKGHPREIALGLAAGLMVGMSPFYGLHIAMGVIVASILGWSKIAAVIGVNITNVATAPFIYPITYWVGAKLTGFSTHVKWPAEPTFAAFMLLLKQSPIIIVDMSIGGIILGIPISIMGYYFSLKAITLYRSKRRKRRLLAKPPRSQASTPITEKPTARQDDGSGGPDEPVRNA